MSILMSFLNIKRRIVLVPFNGTTNDGKKYKVKENNLLSWLKFWQRLPGESELPYEDGVELQV